MPNDLEACAENGSDLAIFDLTENDSNIIDGANVNEVSVSYFENEQDAIDDTNVIPDPENYQSISQDQEVWFKLEDDQTNCTDVGSFILESFISPQIQQTPSIDVCHDDLNSFPVVDLTQNDKTELDVTSPSEAELEYYLTQADADAQTNEIT